jgi:nucleotide-binding universal stress UspA family protein
MHRTIVVGVDGSDDSEAALALAQQLLHPAGRIVLATVVPRSCGLSRPSSGSFYVDGLREQAAQDLERADRWLDPGVRRERRLLADLSVPRALHDLAERVEADLIVLGPSRHRGAGVASWLVRHGHVRVVAASGALAPTEPVPA